MAFRQRKRSEGNEPLVYVNYLHCSLFDSMLEKVSEERYAIMLFAALCRALSR